jgi:SpoVK/Ycf46/Vps4 family AAA+-type ATPase
MFTGYSKKDWGLRALTKLYNIYITTFFLRSKWFHLSRIDLEDLIPEHDYNIRIKTDADELDRRNDRVAVRVLNEVQRLRTHQLVKNGYMKFAINYSSPPLSKFTLTIFGIAEFLQMPELVTYYEENVIAIKKEQLIGERDSRGYNSMSNPDIGTVIAPHYKLDDVILSDDNIIAVKLYVKSVQQKVRLEKLGIKFNPKMLVGGEIGTGKSILAQAIANECGKHLYSVGSDELISAYVGQSAKNVRKMLNHAARYHDDVILFIDEIDGLIPKRGDIAQIRSKERQAAVNTFLELIEQEQQIVMLGATNHAHLLDPAAFSRFTQRIWINRPTRDMLVRILEIHLKEIRRTDDVDLFRIAIEMERNEMTGRDVRNFAVNLGMFMIQEDLDECSRTIFEVALKQIIDSQDVRDFGEQYGSVLYSSDRKGNGRVSNPLDGEKIKRAVSKIITVEIGLLKSEINELHKSVSVLMEKEAERTLKKKKKGPWS